MREDVPVALAPKSTGHAQGRFLRVPRASASPWTPGEARGFLESLLGSPGFDLLVATKRHASVLAQVMRMLPDVSGNLFHDLHTALLMREHGVSRICTVSAPQTALLTWGGDLKHPLISVVR